MWGKNKNEMPSHDLLFGLDEIQPANTVEVLEIRVLEKLVGKDFSEIQKDLNLFKKVYERVDIKMINIEKGSILFLEEADDTGHSNFYKQEVLKVVDRHRGLLECIEPDTFQAKPKILEFRYLLTEKELSELK